MAARLAYASSPDCAMAARRAYASSPLSCGACGGGFGARLGGDAMRTPCVSSRGGAKSFGASRRGAASLLSES